MRRRSKLHLAALFFTLFAIGAVYFIVQNSGQNSFQIGEGAPTGNVKMSPDQAGTDNPQSPSEIPNKDKGEEKEPAPAVDLTWAIERYQGRELLKVTTQEKVVALTFDAGANADGVDPVLGILSENGIPGTFFLTGKFIERYPDKVQALIASGGEIGNHSYDHPYLTHLTSEEVTAKIMGTEDALAKLAPGTKFSPLFRSPYGDRNSSTLATISENGYINIRWTVDSLGWQGTSGGQNKNSVRDKMLRSAAPGAIIMMHLGSNPDDKTHLDSQALPEVIARLQTDGYRFLTLSQMIELEK